MAWEVVRGGLCGASVDALRREADALSEVEAPRYENGCVLEPVDDEAVRARRDDEWRVAAEAYWGVRKVAASEATKAALLGELAALASEFLGCGRVVVFNEHYVVKPAGCEVEFRWHADGDLQLASSGEAQEYVSCWCALDRATRANGCLVFRPDRAAECDPGDVVLMSSRCEHRSGPNASGNAPRRAYYAQYSRGAIELGGAILRLALPCRSDGSLKEEETSAAEWRRVRDEAWAALHDPSRHWRDAPRAERHRYARAAMALARASAGEDEARRSLDLALMVDDGTHRDALLDLIARSEPVDVPELPPQALPSETRRRPLTAGSRLDELRRPSLDTFRRACFEPRRPALIREAMTHWPALERWTDLSYLRRVAGRRVVPVELGEHYLADDWTEELMTLDQFIDRHILSRASRKGYLAQHALFDHIPRLAADIALPDYVALADSDAAPRRNAWFGPANTVSPLHHDRYHNLLCQVLGVKYVRLYAPDLSPRLYPRRADPLHAISSHIVDIDRVDHATFPLFRDAPYFDCLLEPGDMLYIPPHYWHYVESCTASFSVSVWWL